MGDGLHNPERLAAQSNLAEILAMALIERGIIDRGALCSELESLASARRSEGPADVMAAGLARLAISLRAASRT